MFDIPKDVVFAKILVLSNIFGFSAVDWAPKWTKLFDCINTPKVYNFVIFWGPIEVPFEPKLKILNLDFSNTVSLIGTLHLVKISARLNNIWESKGPKPPKRGHFMNAEPIRKTP